MVNLIACREQQIFPEFGCSISDEAKGQAIG